jgi:catechol 2,3-dioxygenase
LQLVPVRPKGEQVREQILSETTDGSRKGFGIPAPGYRLPQDTAVGVVRLQVSELDRSLDYYGHVLGLRPRVRTADTAALVPGDDTRPLVELHAKPGTRPAPRGGALGLFHFAILLPDRPSLSSFVAHLRDLRVYAGMSDHAVSEAVYLTDPDGLGIEVYADRPRSAWQVEKDRQLVMTTIPLDVRSLAKAAAEREWTGMPRGTVMGHVHLHVGDLRAAEHFYHSALGFDKVVWSYPGALFFSAGGYHHHVATNTWSSGAPATEHHARLLSWDLVLPREQDVADAARSLDGAGYAVRHEPGVLTTADPWGTRLHVRAVTPISFL